MTKKVHVYGRSDIGKIRKNNEDDFIAEKIWDDNHLLAVVIDGVGGYEGGEIATEIAKRTIIDYLRSFPDGERGTLLKQAVTEANNIILKERKEEYSGMSCVLTACLIEIDKMRANMAHVGDTRLYRFANNELRKLSHDHSPVGYREDIGDLTEEEAMRHPQRNIIIRDLGSEFHRIDDDFIETGSFPFLPGNMLLMCSDGLSDLLTSSEISRILGGTGSVREKVDRLIAEANAKGGKDNITVVLADFKDKKSSSSKKRLTDKDLSGIPPDEIPMDGDLPQRKKNTKIFRGIILILIAILAAILTILFIFN